MPVTLYCLPCAGASAAMYLRWRRKLPAWLDVRPVELPGRGSRLDETLHTDIDTLVDKLAAELVDTATPPYALFGHSMGGLLAFELAHRLHAAGAPPRSLLVAGCPAPTRRDTSAYAGLRSDAQLLEKLNELQGTPAEVFEHPELLRLTLDILSADFQVCGSYRPPIRPPLPIPLHILSGRDDAIDAPALQAWQQETSAQHSLTLFDGGHFFLQSEEAAVLAHVQTCLTPLAAPIRTADW
jgi:surfactin synthase thioesterase subunit